MVEFDAVNRAKLDELKNPFVNKIVEDYIALCKPSIVTVLTDSPEDIEYVRKLSVKNGEETPLNLPGTTIHFDSTGDLARAVENTKVLLPAGKVLSKLINRIEKQEGLKEITGLLDGIMAGKELIVCFFCLGPTNSRFSIPALQLTDSAYVAHSETILYRPGYEQFKRINGSKEFFHFIHSTGELDENKNSKNLSNRRIYIDLEDERVFSVNTQYAGNTVGLKKLALRLGISKACREDWLCEHMLVMGVKPEGKNRVTYFTGAFPSACGKTSTAMIPGQSIVGDDIAYLRVGKDGYAYAANVEQGIFGIIEDVNPVDDPLIYKTLTTSREMIFSNVLVNDGVPYWLGMGKEFPESGVNYSGKWFKGKKDANGKDVPAASKNARYTIRLNELENVDPNLENPDGVPVSGFIYGGRDSDTNPPVVESLSFAHGVFVGATVESESTAAALGKMGVRAHNPMANLDFIVVPLGVYISQHLKFGDFLDKPPKVFATNYFLKSEGKFLNDKVDKKVWLMWMEGRVHGEYDAIETPIGLIPKYADVSALFKQIFSKEFTKQDYEKQFSIRTTKLLERLDRMQAVFSQEQGIPQEFFNHLSQQKERLEKARKELGEEISPFALEKT